MKSENKKSIIQFIKFCIIGASNTAVSYVFYLSVIGLGGHYVLGNVAGYISGTLYAFFWNNKWVFKKNDDEYRNVWISLIKMMFSYAGTGIVLNSILLVLWVKYLGVPQVIAPAINSAITLTLNFLSNKFWVFKNSKGNPGNKKRGNQ